MNGNDTDGTVQKIREFAATVDNPDNWMIVTPVDSFGDVKGKLDVETSGLGTKYKGISLCYGNGYDETQVKCKQSLDEYLRTRETGSDRLEDDN